MAGATITNLPITHTTPVAPQAAGQRPRPPRRQRRASRSPQQAAHAGHFGRQAAVLATHGRMQIIPICAVAGVPELDPTAAPNGGS
jgi:hypothetical protein